MKKTAVPTRKEMIELLNEDLAREYQAIIAYVVYSQVIKGAKYQHIAYFNGTPVTTPKSVKMSDKPEDLLAFDLENERVTIGHYRQRILQAEAMGEFALSEVLREIIVEEQEHMTDLANALGIDNPKVEKQS